MGTEIRSELTQWRRPAILGLSVGHPSGSNGSIGPFVVSRSGRPGFVSTSFALAPAHAKRGDYIHQPGPSHIEVLTSTTRLAKLVEWTPLVASELNGSAAAVAEFLEGDEPQSYVLPEWSREAGRSIAHPVDPSELSVGDQVAFVGSGSGYSRGRVVVPEFPKIELGSFLYGPGIAIQAESGAFSRTGDGGALVYRCSDCRAVGLVFAREANDHPRSFILPIGRALAALDLRLLS